MPGVLAIVPLPDGVAVVARTFGQAIDAREQLRITWKPGPISHLSDQGIRDQLRAVTPGAAILQPPFSKKIDTAFDFAFVPHAPMETLTAVADVRNGKAEIWYGGQSPITALKEVAAAAGLLPRDVKLHVVRAGGSFGRRLFADVAVEAARISRLSGHPVKLMWTRQDDTRHGRMRPASHHRVTAFHGFGTVLGYDHRIGCVQTDFRHGLGEAFTAVGAALAPHLVSGAFYRLTQKIPYRLGITLTRLAELPLDIPTGSWRSVYTGMTAVVHELMMDELADALRIDPVAFRLSKLPSTDEAVSAVLARVAEAGPWGRSMPAGHGQGVSVCHEFGSTVACLAEVDASHPSRPRVTRVIVAADVGRVVNPRGLEAQLLGGVIDGLSVTLQAGLHIDQGAVREGSFDDYRYARMRDTPWDFEVHILSTSEDIGGAGELSVPAAAAAIANAYGRATGTRPRSFPILG